MLRTASGSIVAELCSAKIETNTMKLIMDIVNNLNFYTEFLNVNSNVEMYPLTPFNGCQVNEQSYELGG